MFPAWRSLNNLHPLKLQPAFSRRFRQRLHSPMKSVMSAIERRLGDAFGDGGFGQMIADRDRRLDVAPVAAAALLRSTAGGDQRDSFQVIDELRVNMFGAAEYSQAWPFARTDNPLAHVSPPAQLLQTFGLLMFHAPASSLRLTGRGGKGLALFAANLLLVIPNAFAFIRLGLAHPAHLGGKLAHLLLVGAFDDDGGRIRQFHRDAVGRTHRYRVGVSNGEDQGLLIQPGLVADTLNPKAFFKTLGDALHHVGDQAPGESMQG